MAESGERFGYEIFKDYENGLYIYKNEFKKLTNYLCGNIYSDYSPNRGHSSDWYNENSNLLIVARWRKHNKQAYRAKYGERVCHMRYSEGEIIDLTHPDYKDHCKICYRCSKLRVIKL